MIVSTQNEILKLKVETTISATLDFTSAITTMTDEKNSILLEQ